MTNNKVTNSITLIGGAVNVKRVLKAYFTPEYWNEIDSKCKFEGYTIVDTNDQETSIKFETTIVPTSVVSKISKLSLDVVIEHKWVSLDKEL